MDEQENYFDTLSRRFLADRISDYENGLTVPEEEEEVEYWWESHEFPRMQDFVANNESRLPQIVRFSQGYKGSNEMHMLPADQYFAHSCTHQKRLVIRGPDALKLSLPMSVADTALVVYSQIGNRKTVFTANLSEITAVRDWKERFDLYVTFKEVIPVVFSDSDPHYLCFKLEELKDLLVIDVYDEKYLVANTLTPKGGMFGTPFLIPTYLPAPVRRAMGIHGMGKKDFESKIMVYKLSVITNVIKSLPLNNDIIILPSTLDDTEDDDKVENMYSYIHPEQWTTGRPTRSMRKKLNQLKKRFLSQEKKEKPPKLPPPRRGPSNVAKFAHKKTPVYNDTHLEPTAEGPSVAVSTMFNQGSRHVAEVSPDTSHTIPARNKSSQLLRRNHQPPPLPHFDIDELVQDERNSQILHGFQPRHAQSPRCPEPPSPARLPRNGSRAAGTAQARRRTPPPPMPKRDKPTGAKIGNTKRNMRNNGNMNGSQAAASPDSGSESYEEPEPSPGNVSAHKKQLRDHQHLVRPSVPLHTRFPKPPVVHAKPESDYTAMSAQVPMPPSCDTLNRAVSSNYKRQIPNYPRNQGNASHMDNKQVINSPLAGVPHATAGISHTTVGFPHAAAGVPYAAGVSHAAGVPHIRAGVPPAAGVPHTAGVSPSAGFSYAGAGVPHAGAGVPHATADYLHAAADVSHKAGVPHAAAGVPYAADVSYAAAGVPPAASVSHATAGVSHVGAGVLHAGTGIPPAADVPPAAGVPQATAGVFRQGLFDELKSRHAKHANKTHEERSLAPEPSKPKPSPMHLELQRQLQKQLSKQVTSDSTPDESATVHSDPAAKVPAMHHLRKDHASHIRAHRQNLPSIRELEDLEEKQPPVALSKWASTNDLHQIETENHTMKRRGNRNEVHPHVQQYPRCPAYNQTENSSEPCKQTEKNDEPPAHERKAKVKPAVPEKRQKPATSAEPRPVSRVTPMPAGKKPLPQAGPAGTNDTSESSTMPLIAILSRLPAARENMTVSDVILLLRGLSLETHIEDFKRNCIDGQILCVLFAKDGSSLQDEFGVQMGLTQLDMFRLKIFIRDGWCPRE